METEDYNMSGEVGDDTDVNDSAYRLFETFCDELRKENKKNPDIDQFCSQLAATAVIKDDFRRNLQFAAFMHMLFENDIPEPAPGPAEIEAARHRLWERFRAEVLDDSNG